jgi:acetylglutamate kinase
MQPIVIKISGHELNDDAFLTEFAEAVASIQAPKVIVHGGGKDITQLQERLGVETRFINGIRITDAESLMIAEIVLSGLVNKRIVRFLLNANLQALGISGVDAGLIQAQKMQADVDMQFTGEICGVNIQPLLTLLNAGFTPVISPISGSKTTHYNVNADHVAGAIAKQLSAERLIFVSNIQGVLNAEKQLIPTLTPSQTKVLIAQEVISGGMIPKVNTAIEALEGGAHQVVITNLYGLKTQNGTTFLNEESS